MNLVLSAGGVVVVIVAAFGVLVGRLLSSTRVRSFDPEAFRHFSTDSYLPMSRLLSRDDIQFLRTQPGYEPRIERELLKARRNIFRVYLRSMGQDFNRLHRALRLMVLHAPEDRSELAVFLVRQKVRFFSALAFAHIKLTLHTLGIGDVDITALVQMLDSMRIELQNLVPAPRPVAG